MDDFMRLYELISTLYKTTDREFDRDTISGVHNYDEMDPTVGGYGKVDIDPADPHIVKKKYHQAENNLENDGYYNYIKAIADGNLSQSNPFFPRVYSVDIETDKEGRQRPIFDIETLVPVGDIDEDMIMELGERLFVDYDSVAELALQNFKGKIWNSSKILATALRYVIEESRYDLVSNAKLRQALQMIGKLCKGGKGRLDLHFNNIMFRGTPHGPQLVLTDPIS